MAQRHPHDDEALRHGLTPMSQAEFHTRSMSYYPFSCGANQRIHNFLLSHWRTCPGVRSRIAALRHNHQSLECMIPTRSLETSLLGGYGVMTFFLPFPRSYNVDSVPE